MIELTPLEQAVLAGSDTERNKALSARHKAEQDAAKTAEREAATAAEVARDINDQADKHIHTVERQISDDAAALLEPLTHYAPAFTPPLKNALVMHLKHLQRQAAQAEQRQALVQRLADIDRQAADLEAKKLNLAALARQNPQDLETLGGIALADMDLNVLAGVRGKYQAALAELPAIGPDRSEQDWLNSVKTAKESALTHLIKTCEAVAGEAIAKLYALDSGKYAYYNHAARYVHGKRSN